jgi:hypothetical protein
VSRREKKKREKKKGRKRRAQVVGFNTLNNFCLCGFFFFVFTLANFRHCCAHTFERARLRAFLRKLSVVMTRQQQQQRDEGDDAIALIQVPIGDSGEHVSIDPRNLSRTNVEDILGVLQSELAPLRVWLECAKAYLAEDNEAAFLEIVGSGCSPGEQRAFLVSLSSSTRRRSLSSSSSSSIVDEWRSDVDDRVSPTFADTFVLSFSLSLFERRQRQHYNNRNRTVLPERRVRSRETFVLLGRAPGKRCRQITIRRKRKRKRRASEYYERAKTTRTFNASG